MNNRDPFPVWRTLHMAGLDRPSGPPRPQGVMMLKTDAPMNRQQRRLADRMQRRHQSKK